METSNPRRAQWANAVGLDPSDSQFCDVYGLDPEVILRRLVVSR